MAENIAHLIELPAGIDERYPMFRGVKRQFGDSEAGLLELNLVLQFLNNNPFLIALDPVESNGVRIYKFEYRG